MTKVGEELRIEPSPLSTTREDRERPVTTRDANNDADK